MTRHIMRWTAILAMILMMGEVYVGEAQKRGGGIDENFLLLMGARNAVKAGKGDTALRRYRTLLERDPRLNDVREEFGWALIAAGKISEAEEQFRIVLNANPKDITAWKGLLESLRKSEKKDEILKTLERLVELEPTRRDLRMQLALELHNRGRFADAEKHIIVLLGE